MKDYSYVEPIDGYISKSKDSSKLDLITGTDTGERLLRKLKDKRIELMIEDESVVKSLLKIHPDLQAAGIKQVDCLKAQPLCVAFSPANKLSKVWAEKFSEGMKKLKSGKRVQEIYSKYGLGP